MTSLQRLADTCVEHGLELVRLYKGFLVKLRELIVLFATAGVTLLQVQVQSLRHYVNHLSGARCFGQCDPRRRGELEQPIDYVVAIFNDFSFRFSTGTTPTL